MATGRVPPGLHAHHLIGHIIKMPQKEEKAVTFNTNYLGTNIKLEPKKSF
jgi:hypothetical protein